MYYHKSTIAQIYRKSTCMAIILCYVLSLHCPHYVFGATDRTPIIDTQVEIKNTEPALSAVTLSPRLGEIITYHKGKNGKSIVHIQDAHCNPSCQLSAASIIDYLRTAYNVRLVLSEGGVGAYDFTLFHDVADKNLREITAKSFVQSGEITGAEYYVINNPGKVIFLGMEDEELYIKNLNVYRDLSSQHHEIMDVVSQILRLLLKLKVELYSEEMKKFEINRKKYRAGTIDLKKYLANLFLKAREKGLKIDEHSVLKSFVDLVLEEKNIDFDTANSERRRIVDILSKRLPQYELGLILEKTTEFTQKNMLPQDYYRFLFDKAKLVNLDLKEYPNLYAYSEYMRHYYEIPKEKLFSDIESLQDNIVSKTAINEVEVRLYKMSRYCERMKDFFGFTLTKSEFENYREEKEISFDDVAKFLQEHISHINETPVNFNSIKELKTFIPHAEKFYTYSLRRDDAFLKNTENALTSEKVDSAIILTGGVPCGEPKKAIYRSRIHLY